MLLHTLLRFIHNKEQQVTQVNACGRPEQWCQRNITHRPRRSLLWHAYINTQTSLIIGSVVTLTGCWLSAGTNCSAINRKTIQYLALNIPRWFAGTSIDIQQYFTQACQMLSVTFQAELRSHRTWELQKWKDKHGNYKKITCIFLLCILTL